MFTDTEPIARSVRRRGLHAGDSLTLSTGWNFLLAADRQKGLGLDTSSEALCGGVGIFHADLGHLFNS